MKDQTQQFLDSLPELEPGKEFKFACHPDVPCFNACCSDLNLMLTPYDVLRLRRALNMGSHDFIRTQAEVATAPDTGLPAFRLRMSDDKRHSCPYVSPKGCTVYENRPAACRTYPLGRATRIDENGEVGERFFVVREPHCKGFNEDKMWSSETWLSDQGLIAYNENNDHYMRLLARVKEAGRPVPPKHANMAALALYQLDSFKDFILQTGVLERLDVTDERKKDILENEEARLAFAVSWLELLLFGSSENLRPKA